MQDIDHDKIAQIIREVAADKIIPRFQQLQKSDIRTKSSPTDFVTIADEEAEVELTYILKDLLPGSYVVGEEAVSSGTVLRDILHDKNATVWVVDPVDGTSNFAHGRPVYGTMVALIHGGERIGGWIYQIPKDRMVSAEKGAGVRMDGAAFTPLPKIRDDAPFDGMRAFISTKFMPSSLRPVIEAKTQNMIAETYMCCAWEYVELLEGNSTFSIYKRIEPWDHLAGTLILEEAGFYVRKWDGLPYTPGDLTGGLINASSQAVWQRIFDRFLKGHIES